MSREIRAQYTQDSVVVYQAYPAEIADPALRAGTFVPPFRMGRMTWIKPSFLWMMYRSGWATKVNQERILAITITRQGFEWALAHSCLSSFDSSVYASRDEWQSLLKQSPVRIQWDPERDIHLEPQPNRAIQIGLSGEAVDKYVGEWIVSIEDVTSLAYRVHDAETHGQVDLAMQMLPVETAYPVSESLRGKLGAGHTG
ncbi:DUF4291 domain-containing protein [Streptomyces boninensis]|uniref:DUF4291 domain-containing protein n=1 Tax=Streptomyces boninensis TaxID=2039455 RepID=UPI003B212DFA